MLLTLPSQRDKCRSIVVVMTSWLTCLLIHHSPHPVCEQLHYCPSAHSAAILQPLVLNNPTFCNNLLCFFSLQSWLIPAMICVLKAKSGQPIALFKNLLTTSLCNRTKSKVLVLRKTSLFVTWRLPLWLFFHTLSSFLRCPPSQQPFDGYDIQIHTAVHASSSDPGFNPWVGKIPWRRTCIPVFLPGESPWTEEPGGLQSMGLQRVRHDWETKHNTFVI